MSHQLITYCHIGIDKYPEYRKFIGKREMVLFAAPIGVYDSKMVSPKKRFLIITRAKLIICGWEFAEVVKGQPPVEELTLKYQHNFEQPIELWISSFKDNVCLIKNVDLANIKTEAPEKTDVIFETRYLTEALYVLKKKSNSGANAHLVFKDNWDFAFAKKTKGFKAKLGLAKRVKSLNFMVSDDGSTSIRKRKANVFDYYGPNLRKK